ncbi:hypothetical protein Ddye_004013 [Dipteronia dyeriana]|uniref:Uncharacterized protein n=1 Tax=Dipteronia dyeriana TaxID=168575 RepID=A0AAE0CW00_9ROSI|nr:hypothetical protein Ddye_004013 [Dipteronia dyeriana]
MQIYMLDSLTLHYSLLNVEHILVLLPAKAISARTAKGQVILLESAPMWRFVTIVAFLGTLLQSAPQRHYAGTVGNQVTWLAIVPTRESATPAARVDIVLETAQLPHCHQGT